MGKGTLCKKLAEVLGFCHIPTGELLRREVDRGSRYSKFIQDSIDNSFVVPADLMIRLILAEAKGHKLLFLDGFPRSFDQLSIFEQLVIYPTFMITHCSHFQVSPRYSTLLLKSPSKEVLKARLMKRGISSSRTDDEEQKIDQRLEAYSDESSLHIHLENVENGGKFMKVSWKS